MVERILLVPVLLSALGCGAVLFDPAEGTASARVVERIPVREQARINLRKSPDGLFRMPARLDGTPATLIVDTGSTRSVIARRTLQRIGAPNPPQASRGALLTFDGEVPYTLATIRRLEIAGQVIGPIEVAVIDGAQVPDVLGQDIIAQLGIISIAQDRMIIDRSDN